MDSVVQYLADKGAKLDVKNADGMTPLDIVVDGIAKPVEISGRSHREDWIFRSHRGPPQEVDGRRTLLEEPGNSISVSHRPQLRTAGPRPPFGTKFTGRCFSRVGYEQYSESPPDPKSEKATDNAQAALGTLLLCYSDLLTRKS